MLLLTIILLLINIAKTMTSDLDNINEILKECDINYITELIEFDSNGAIVGLGQYWYRFEEIYKLFRNDYKYTIPINEVRTLMKNHEDYGRPYKDFPYDFTGKDTAIYDDSMMIDSEGNINIGCIEYYLSNSKYKDKFESILKQFWQIIDDTNNCYDDIFSILKNDYIEDLLHEALLTERSKIKFIMFKEGEYDYTDKDVAGYLGFFITKIYKNIYYTGELALEVIKVLFCDCPKITEILKEYINISSRTAINTIVSDEFKNAIKKDYRTTFDREFAIEYIKYVCEEINIPYYGL